MNCLILLIPFLLCTGAPGQKNNIVCFKQETDHQKLHCWGTQEEIMWAIVISWIMHALQSSSVQLLSCVQLFATPWSAACQASLSITNSQSLLKLMSIESVIPSNHVILCHPLLHLRSIFPSIRVFSNESALCIRWPK